MQTFIDQLLQKRHLLAFLTVLLGAAVCWGVTYTSIDSSFDAILAEDELSILV